MKFTKVIKATDDWSYVFENFIDNLEDAQKQCLKLSNKIDTIYKFLLKRKTNGELNIKDEDLANLFKIMGKLQDIAEGNDPSLRNVIKSLGISHK